MNISEAISQRIPRIRKPEWANETAYLRLPLLPEGEAGAWAELYDDVTQREVLSVNPGSQKIMVFMSDDTDFEIYEGAISPHEDDSDNFSKSYTES